MSLLWWRCTHTDVVRICGYRRARAQSTAEAISRRNLHQKASQQPYNQLPWRRCSSTSSKGKQVALGPPVITCQNLKKVLPGGRTLFQDCNLSFLMGAKIGILGANGSGKSSFVKVLAGEDKEYDGTVWVKEGVTVKYVAQEPQLNPEKNVIENVREGFAEHEELLQRFNDVSALMGDPDADFDQLLTEQGELQERIDAMDAWNLEHRMKTAMHKLHIPPPDSLVTTLSGGEKRRVALCQMVLQAPDVIILDEPTNHLDAESAAWLEDYLQKHKGTVIAITHDRYFLDNMAGFILEVDRGLMFAYEGNYTSWLQQKSRRLDMEKLSERKQAKRMADELQWIQGTRKGSHKARVEKYESNLKESENIQGRLQDLQEGAIVIPPGARLGQTVLTVKGLTKSFDGRMLFQKLNLKMDSGSIVGVIGKNGSGKSTLFNIIAGIEKADSGVVEWGPSANFGVVSQARIGLDPNKSAYEEIAQGEDAIKVGNREVAVRAYVASFNLRGPAQEKKVGNMSGGERNRVHLAKVLKNGHNVLLLDEPTNDLDVETLRSLENALAQFPGCAMIISHDRWFLDRICTDMVVFEDDGTVNVFPGNLSEYTEYMRKKGMTTRVDI